jgi:hypothetical protein
MNFKRNWRHILRMIFVCFVTHVQEVQNKMDFISKILSKTDTNKCLEHLGLHPLQPLGL